MKLTGPGGLLGDLTKRVLEAGLEGEMDGPLGVNLGAMTAFSCHLAFHGGAAAVRRFLPGLVDLVHDPKFQPGLGLPLGQVADGYRATDVAVNWERAVR